MLRGYVERRINQRISFKTQLAIDFFRDDKSLASGVSSDISAGGMQFFLPLESDFAEVGDKIDLIFHLDIPGKQLIHSQICHKSYGIDNDLRRIMYYGVKFLDLSIETWNYIYDFCTSQNQLPSMEPSKPTKIVQERQDIRVDTALLGHLDRDKDKKSIPCLVDDLSYGGAKLHLPVSLELNELVQLVIENTESDLPIPGQCIWIRPMDPETKDFYAGIRFERLNLEMFNKLRSLLFKISNPS